MSWFHSVMVHLSQLTGTSSSASRSYNFWSGFGSDLGELAIFGGLVQIYRRHKCATCPRVALKGEHGHVKGTHYYTCHKHTDKDTHDSLVSRHKVLHSKMHEHLNPPVRKTRVPKETA